jgi:Fe-S-cluster-containing dehydrogenase component
LEPYCVWNCPNHARTYGDLDDPMSKISVAMKGYRDRGYKIYQLPDAGTTTHVAAYYAEKP